MCFNDLSLYFENSAGQVREHPLGYAIICHRPGKRHGTDLMVLFTHAGDLLQARGWNRLLSDQRLIVPYTLEEAAWVRAFWAGQQASSLHQFRVAVVATPFDRKAAQQ